MLHKLWLIGMHMYGEPIENIQHLYIYGRVTRLYGISMKSVDGVHEFNWWMNHPSNIEIGLWCYKKWTNNKWTYNLTDHLMLDLETMIAIAYMTYIIDLEFDELHLGDEKIFNGFISKC